MKSIIEYPNDYIVCDIETTGLDKNVDEIIEISALKYRNNELVDVFNFLTKIHQPLDPFITELTGITEELLEKNGNDLKEVLEKFILFVEDDYLILHNFSFDIWFLKYNIKKLLNRDFEPKCICTYRLSRKRFKRNDNCTLANIASEYKIDTTNNHRATKDCEITNSVYHNLMKDLLEEYGSIENLKKSFNYKSKKVLRENLEIDLSEINQDNPFFEKHICITGKLEEMDKNTAFKNIFLLGGYRDDTITKQTNYLIEANKIENTKDGKSNKQKKVEERKLKGQDIDVLNENTFYEIIEEYSK